VLVTSTHCTESVAALLCSRFKESVTDTLIPYWLLPRQLSILPSIFVLCPYRLSSRARLEAFVTQTELTIAMYRIWLISRMACITHGMYHTWHVLYMACIAYGMFCIWHVLHMACITYGMYNKHMACIAYGMYRTWHNQTYYSTGDGHFSPIGAYHAENDLVLILDVARFK